MEQNEEDRYHHRDCCGVSARKCEGLSKLCYYLRKHHSRDQKRKLASVSTVPTQQVAPATDARAGIKVRKLSTDKKPDTLRREVQKQAPALKAAFAQLTAVIALYKIGENKSDKLCPTSAALLFSQVGTVQPTIDYPKCAYFLNQYEECGGKPRFFRRHRLCQYVLKGHFSTTGHDAANSALANLLERQKPLCNQDPRKMNKINMYKALALLNGRTEASKETKSLNKRRLSAFLIDQKVSYLSTHGGVFPEEPAKLFSDDGDSSSDDDGEEEEDAQDGVE